MMSIGISIKEVFTAIIVDYLERSASAVISADLRMADFAQNDSLIFFRSPPSIESYGIWLRPKNSQPTI